MQTDILTEGTVLKKKGSANTYRTVDGWDGAYLKVHKQNGMPDRIHIDKLDQWEVIAYSKTVEKTKRTATNPRIRKTISGPCHNCNEYREWLITPVFFEPKSKISFAVECPTCGMIVPQESWQTYVKTGVVEYEMEDE